MKLDLPLPDRTDPVWTAANGFVVRAAEGITKLINGGQETFSVKVTGKDTNGRLSLMEGEVSPGFGNLPHAHGGEDEAFLVMSGEFRFINGNQTIDAGPGDFIYIPRGTRHGFKNLSTRPAKLLVFYTPAGAEEFFLEHGEDPDPSGKLPPPWSEEKFSALAEALTAHKMILLPDSEDWK